MGTAKSSHISQFNPLAWGMLFFTLWLITRTVGELNTPQEIISWAFLAISGILFLSIVIPPLARVMATKAAEEILVPFIFFSSILGFVFGWLGSLKDITGWQINIGVIFGMLWFIAYLMVLTRTAPKYFGIAFSAVFFILGIYVLVAEANIWGGVMLVVIGAILCLVATRILPIYRDSIFGDLQED